MDDEQVMHAMSIDDAYRVEQVLARGDGSATELVMIDGTGPFVRKKIPSAQANRGVWAALSNRPHARLPHVVATYELPDRFVIACDYVAGKTLEEHVSENGRLDAEEAVAIARDVCEAVCALHGQSIVHRDIAPGNVVLAQDGAHLIDLGCARLLTLPDTDREDTRGTWGFAAPEQYGFAKTDKRSDVYAIGRLLGYMLTGVYPADEGFEPALARLAEQNGGLVALIERTTSFEPSVRYADAHELADALEASATPSTGDATSSASATAAPSPHPAPTEAPTVPADKKRARKRRAIAAAVALVAAALIGGALLLGTDILSGQHAETPQAHDDAQDTDDALTAPDSENLPQAPAGSTSSPSGSEGDAIADALDVVESGWYSSHGTVYFVVAVKNTSDDACIEFPTVRITGRDESDDVEFTEDFALMELQPGETQYVSSVCTSTGDPAAVEFEPVASQGSFTSHSAGDPWEFEVENLSEKTDPYGGLRVTGEIRTVREGDSALGSGTLLVSLILRDETGAIVYGTSSFADLPREGNSAPFQVESYDHPGYETVEVHAVAW